MFGSQRWLCPGHFTFVPRHPRRGRVCLILHGHTPRCAREAGSQPDLLFAGMNGAFEWVHREVHAESFVLEKIACARLQSTSRIASTSTDIPFGREPMPTADRAWRPASPSASTNKSEQPLMTFGCAAKSGSALTIPSSFTTAEMRLSSP